MVYTGIAGDCGGPGADGLWAGSHTRADDCAPANPTADATATDATTADTTTAAAGPRL